MSEPSATVRARSLRKRMPLTERVLWPLLRGRRLEGLKFRRQVPLAGYVVDFACFSPRLVVEADGPFHDRAADAERDAALKAQGFTVLRFRNQDIDRNPGVVLSAILQAAQRGAAAPSSDPLSRATFSHGGEKERNGGESSG